jgi:hypothetical protein
VDAEPRSASVEALTNLHVQIIDGEKVLREISSLPSWVKLVFKNVFYRFRELDRKITVLQSMNEYQKKSFRQDTPSKMIYMELLRFIKLLKLLYSKTLQISGKVHSETVLKELDDSLGERFIGLKVFWKLLKEYDIIDNHTDETIG